VKKTLRVALKVLLFPLLVFVGLVGWVCIVVSERKEAQPKEEKAKPT